MSDHQGIGRGIINCRQQFCSFLATGRPSIFSIGIYTENGQYRNKSHIIEVRSFTNTKGGQVYNLNPLYLDFYIEKGDYSIFYEGGPNIDVNDSPDIPDTLDSPDIPDFEEDIMKTFYEFNPEIHQSDLVCHWSYNELADIPCDPKEFMKGYNPNYMTKEEFMDLLE